MNAKISTVELKFSSGINDRLRAAEHTLVINLENEADQPPKSQFLEDLRMTNQLNFKILKSLLLLRILNP